MDRLLYVAMTGASQVMTMQDINTQNLANVSTPGYRQQEGEFRTYLADAQPGTLPTRAWVVAGTPGANFAPGVITQTGNPLDVALTTPGMIAVQGADGRPAYVRSASLSTNPQGFLQTPNGNLVLGDAGPIQIPEGNSASIAPDGTVSVIPIGQNLNATTTVGRILLVNPPEKQLVRGDDGLFRMQNGQPAQPDANVRLTSGALEGSNVNVVDAMTQMINLARQFDLQTKMMQTADTNDQQTTRVLNLNA